jgi:hypothetical protein
MPVDIKPTQKTTDVLPPQTQAQIDPIQIAVTNCTDFRESVLALLNGVSAQITEVKDDPNQVAKIAAQLKERAGTWADNIVANTGYAGVTSIETEKGKAEREAKEHKDSKEHKPAEKK